jgi:hypothetical protein
MFLHFIYLASRKWITSLTSNDGEGKWHSHPGLAELEYGHDMLPNVNGVPSRSLLTGDYDISPELEDEIALDKNLVGRPSQAVLRQLLCPVFESNLRLTCQFCKSATFETEYEAMVHRLICSSNKKAPLLGMHCSEVCNGTSYDNSSSAIRGNEIIDENRSKRVEKSPKRLRQTIITILRPKYLNQKTTLPNVPEENSFDTQSMSDDSSMSMSDLGGHSSCCIYHEDDIDGLDTNEFDQFFNDDCPKTQSLSVKHRGLQEADIPGTHKNHSPPYAIFTAFPKTSFDRQ